MAIEIAGVARIRDHQRIRRACFGEGYGAVFAHQCIAHTHRRARRKGRRDNAKRSAGPCGTVIVGIERLVPFAALGDLPNRRALAHGAGRIARDVQGLACETCAKVGWVFEINHRLRSRAACDVKQELCACGDGRACLVDLFDHIEGFFQNRRKATAIGICDFNRDTSSSGHRYTSSGRDIRVPAAIHT